MRRGKFLTDLTPGVTAQARVIRVKQDKPSRALVKPQKPWAPNELRYLEKYYGKVSKAEMEYKLGRTWECIRSRAYKLFKAINNG